MMLGSNVKLRALPSVTVFPVVLLVRLSGLVHFEGYCRNQERFAVGEMPRGNSPRTFASQGQKLDQQRGCSCVGRKGSTSID